jgi:hypothetical protein
MAMSDRARRWVSDWSGSSNSVPTSKTPTTQSKPVLPGTLIRWKHQIAAWHEAQLSNGHTEAAVNNLLKRVKREAFGFTSFRNYRIRSLLYVGPPNCDLLATRSDASFTALPFHRRNSENDSASLNGGVPTPAGLVGARD